MFTLRESFLATVERDPNALAIEDDNVAYTYNEWLPKICALANNLKWAGVKVGDRVIAVLQNRWENCTLYWACQLAGFVYTPLNWRAKAAEIKYYVADSGAVALVFQDISEQAVETLSQIESLLLIAVDDCSWGKALHFQSLLVGSWKAPSPEISARDTSIMLYTSGTTGRPKGVPRSHHAERIAGIAHILQNFYERGEVTLGVMPLYHTMGIRSLISMSLVAGTFICLHRFSASEALLLISQKKISCLYLVPTLYHDLLTAADTGTADFSTVRRIGFAGASMTQGLVSRVEAAFHPKWFVNHYGSTEIYTLTVNQNAARKPGSAGKAGINQLVRIIHLNSTKPDDVVERGLEGQIIALMNGDEAFDGYWRHPEADAKAIHQGWYFTGDCGYLDPSGDLFITGRVDDMIISGGENISPQEVEDCLSVHEAVSEVAVFGLSDERWGQVVAAAIVRNDNISAEDLDLHCQASGLANLKRPRHYLFVKAIPKSPVGKILRRLLVAGDFDLDQADDEESLSPC